MRYYIKRPGSLLWESLATDSLITEVEQGRLQGVWKIRREDDSTEYTVDELIREPGRKGEAVGSKLHSAGNAGTTWQTEAPAPRRTLFFALSIILIVTFLWRAFTAAHEYDSREFVYFSIGLDVLCIVALIASKMQISRATPPDGEPWVAGNLLFFIALMAGLGLLVIRFDGSTASLVDRTFALRLLPTTLSLLSPRTRDQNRFWRANRSGLGGASRGQRLWT
jgi:hypothetical protein